MDKELYHIRNVGCDATTQGIAELSDSEIALLNRVVSDLNQNSYYGCMPRIFVQKISWNNLTDVTGCLDDVDLDDRLYLGSKVYKWADDEVMKSILSNEEDD